MRKAVVKSKKIIAHVFYTERVHGERVNRYVDISYDSDTQVSDELIQEKLNMMSTREPLIVSFTTSIK